MTQLKWTNSDSDAVPALGLTGITGVTVTDLHVVYQPIVDLASHATIAHEALVRCSVPELKSPLDLLKRAVDESAVGRLGRSIRELAFSNAPGQPLFVNVHPDELATRWFVRPDDAMVLHDSQVFLEITEAAAMTHHELCASVLKEVCARIGALLVVDDFGAGHSDLKRVLDLEPAVLKLDASLIRGIDTNLRQAKIVRHLVRMAVDLGAMVVAEGIETYDELAAVADSGAHFGQGYVLARPSFPLSLATWPAKGDCEH